MMHRKQYDFFHSRKTYVGYCGGRGAGKTFSGALKILHAAIQNPNRHYRVAAPTYKILKDTSIRTVNELADKLQIKQVYHQTDHQLTLTNGAKIDFRSAEDPDTLRGPNLSGFWLDEAGDLKEEAFNIAIACLREGGVMGQMFVTFTPRGKKHWTYPLFVNGNSDITELFQCSTGENPFLPEQFEAVLSSKYTSHFAAQELGGEFIEGEGLMFKQAWFEKFAKHIPQQARRVRYWDRASSDGKGCFTCGVLMAHATDGLFYVEDVVRGQWDPDAREKIIKSVSYADRGKYGNVRIVVEQEPGSSGVDSFKATAKMLAGFPIFPDKVTGNKATRAEPMAAQYGAGNIYLLEDAPWLADFIEEHRMFPGSKLKDQVDAAAGAFNQLTNSGSFSGPVTGGQAPGSGGSSGSGPTLNGTSKQPRRGPVGGQMGNPFATNGAGGLR